MTGANSSQPLSKRARLVRRIRKIAKVFRRKSHHDSTPTKSLKTPTINKETTISGTQNIDCDSQHHGIDKTTHPPQVFQKQNKPPPPFHLTLMGLPRELRDLIFHHVFASNGTSYVRQQLLGFPMQDYSTYCRTFRVLLTCRQFYGEAFPYAYRLSCFYWFKSYTTATLERLCHRLNARQAANVRHIAFWSNPYLYEDFLDEIPESLRLTRITVCSNYMSGPIPQGTVQGRMMWLLKNIRKLQSLRSFHFLTGCGIAPGSKRLTDCEFAAHLRLAFERKSLLGREGVEVGKFDAETLTAVIRVLPDEEGGKTREVDLQVASVYEDGFGIG